MTQKKTKSAHQFTTTRRKILGASAAMAPMLMLPKRVFAASGKTLTLLHTNDTHSRMQPFESGPFKGKAGVARRATLIKAARKNNPCTFVVDAGDTFQGTAWFNTFKGEIDCKVLNALRYDATCVGNHDFDAGTQQLRKALDLAPNLAAIAANFELEDDCALSGRVKRHHIVNREGVKVGFFGLGIAFEGLVNPRLCQGVSYSDPRQAARRSVALLREQKCDVVIALSHLGFQGRSGEPGDQDWPEDVAGVDYVVGGHTHTFLKEPKVIRHRSGWETPIMQVGHSGLNLGHAEIDIGRGRARVRAARPVGVGGKAIA